MILITDINCQHVISKHIYSNMKSKEWKHCLLLEYSFDNVCSDHSTRFTMIEQGYGLVAKCITQQQQVNQLRC